MFFETLHGVALKRFQNSLEISLYPVRLFYLSRCGLYDLVEASLLRPAITHRAVWENCGTELCIVVHSTEIATGVLPYSFSKFSYLPWD